VLYLCRACNPCIWQTAFVSTAQYQNIKLSRRMSIYWCGSCHCSLTVLSEAIFLKPQPASAAKKPLPHITVGCALLALYLCTSRHLTGVHGPRAAAGVRAVTAPAGAEPAAAAPSLNSSSSSSSTTNRWSPNCCGICTELDRDCGGLVWISVSISDSSSSSLVCGFQAWHVHAGGAR
jgi:hypothetical protein